MKKEFVTVLRINVNDGERYIYVDEQFFNIEGYGEDKIEVEKTYQNVPYQFFKDTAELIAEWNG